MEFSKSFVAVPPGETIKEQLESRSLSQREFAIRMGLTEKHISHLINGKVQLTTDVAMRLEDVLGLPAKFWLNLENDYRETLARVKEENEMDEEIASLSKFPYAEMVKFHWMPAAKNAREKVHNLRAFFEVARLTYINNLSIPGIAYRALGQSKNSNYSLAAWAQKAKIVARERTVKKINIEKLNSMIEKIRELTTEQPDVFCERLIAILAECGIVIVFLPHFKASFVHGATFIDGNHIVVCLSVRGKYADKFWFSLFHELGHILLGHLDPSNTTAEQEKMADEFARNILIKEESYKIFVGKGVFTKSSIVKFAADNNIDAGIVLGRLQKDNKVKFSMYNDLKQQYALS